MKLVLALLLAVTFVGVVHAAPQEQQLTMTWTAWMEDKWMLSFPEQAYYFVRGYDMQVGKHWWSTDTYEISKEVYESTFLEPNEQGHVENRICTMYFYDYEEIARGFICKRGYSQNLPLVIYRERWR